MHVLNTCPPYSKRCSPVCVCFVERRYRLLLATVKGSNEVEGVCIFMQMSVTSPPAALQSNTTRPFHSKCTSMIVLRFCPRQLIHYYPFISSFRHIHKHLLVFFLCIQWSLQPAVKHNVQTSQLGDTGKYGWWRSSEEGGGAGGRVLMQSEVARRDGGGDPSWEIFSDQVQRD